MPFNQPLGGNEMPRFGGPATFMRLPAQADAQGLDVAFVGIPMDIGTSNRPGTRLGPRQIRDESRMLRPYNMATGAAPFDHLQCADIGDVAIKHLRPEEIGRHHHRSLRPHPRRRRPAPDHGRRPHADLAPSCGRSGESTAPSR